MWFDERQEKRRRGSMFVETAIGIALAIVVMIAVAQLVGLAVKQRREAADLRQATEAVANVMEHLVVLPWDELTLEGTKRFEVPAKLANLVEPELSVTVVRTDDAFPTKRIDVAVSWPDMARRRVEPVRLVAWKHQATKE